MLNLITNRKHNNSIFDFNNFFSDIIPNNKIMKLDIKETTNNFEIDVELPGVSKEDINVSIAEDILTISVNKSEETNKENTKYIRKERKYGSYSRSFSIPNIDAELINANYNNGILRLILPKKLEQEATTKTIHIE